MTVATKVEAPVKFLYASAPTDPPKAYPFSVLGLGDVVIPGLFVRFMSKIDDELGPNEIGPSYFTATSIAYALGERFLPSPFFFLSLTFYRLRFVFSITRISDQRLL